MSGFKRATKQQAKARVAVAGPSGSGKTLTGLITATVLADGGPIAFIDSERGSASKYADRFEFDVMDLERFHPRDYIAGIQEASRGGYQVLVIDSITHAWQAVLDVVDQAKGSFGGNSYMAWSKGTPLWQGLLDAILACPMHVIVTMRSKSKYVEVEERGKKSYQRAGAEPVARDGVEYEFDFVCDLDLDHDMRVSKTRAGEAVDTFWRSPGPEFGRQVLAWLTDGAPAPEPPPPPGPDSSREVKAAHVAAGTSAAGDGPMDRLLLLFPSLDGDDQDKLKKEIRDRGITTKGALRENAAVVVALAEGVAALAAAPADDDAPGEDAGDGDAAPAQEPLPVGGEA